MTKAEQYQKIQSSASINTEEALKIIERQLEFRKIIAKAILSTSSMSEEDHKTALMVLNKANDNIKSTLIL